MSDDLDDLLSSATAYSADWLTYSYFSRPNFSSHDETYYNSLVGMPTYNLEQQVLNIRVEIERKQ